MAPYAKPDDYGWTCTPSPGGGGGGGGGGGTGPEDWTEVDLSVTAGTPNGFWPMKKNGELWRWEWSNPSPGILRLKNNSNGAGGLWQNDQQEGPALIVPQQIQPRTFTNPPGVTGNQWRSEDCRLYIEVEFDPAGFKNAGAGAPNGVGLGVGPILACYNTDWGSGAAFIANNPIPKFDSYTHVRASKENNQNDNVWRNTFTLGSGTSGGSWNTPTTGTALGSVGTSNVLSLAVGGQYKNAGSGREVGAIASTYDARVTSGGVQDWWEFNNHFDHRNYIEGKYVYVGLAVGSWLSGGTAEGTYLDIVRFRYRVQPLKNRSL